MNAGEAKIKNRADSPRSEATRVSPPIGWGQVKNEKKRHINKHQSTRNIYCCLTEGLCITKDTYGNFEK